MLQPAWVKMFFFSFVFFFVFFSPEGGDKSNIIYGGVCWWRICLASCMHKVCQVSHGHHVKWSQQFHEQDSLIGWFCVDRFWLVFFYDMRFCPFKMCSDTVTQNSSRSQGILTVECETIATPTFVAAETVSCAELRAVCVLAHGGTPWEKNLAISDGMCSCCLRCLGDGGLSGAMRHHWNDGLNGSEWFFF